MTAYTLILLRHGESDWNQKNLFTGWVDVDLTAKGEQEARRGGELLKEHGLLPDVVHTSLLRRAIRTNEIALHAADRHWIQVRRSWRLDERHYGALQGLEVPITIGLVVLLGVVFLAGFAEAVGIAVVIVAVYLTLNLVVVVGAIVRVAGDPVVVSNWAQALTTSHSSPWAIVGIALLVFFGAFIPVVGAAVSGAVAVLLALVALGPIQALIMLGIILAVQQIEAHLLQPILVGRVMKIHPLAILLGTFIGTYSSIYVSAPALVWLGLKPDSFLRSEDEEAGLGNPA